MTFLIVLGIILVLSAVYLIHAFRHAPTFDENYNIVETP